MHRRVKRTQARRTMTAPCAEGGFTLAHKHTALLLASQRGDTRSGSPATSSQERGEGGGGADGGGAEVNEDERNEAEGGEESKLM